jgi:hypothetical protein
VSFKTLFVKHQKMLPELKPKSSTLTFCAIYEVMESNLKKKLMTGSFA